MPWRRRERCWIERAPDTRLGALVRNRKVPSLLAGAVALVLALLVIAQLVLPGIAAQRIRDRLARSGRVLDVQVHAFPAIELLWNHADSATVRMASYRASAARLSSNIGQLANVGSFDASVTALSTGLLTLRDATLRKRGSQLSGSAIVSDADLTAALPILQSVRPVASSGGALTLQGTAAFLGVAATVNATVRAVNGALVVSPDVPFGGLATITLFSNPKIAVQGVAASPTPGGFALTGLAQLR
jgi:hypothetical protein